MSVTREQCLEILSEFCNNNSDKIVTRDLFRSSHLIKEESWVQYFGTFAEYKRAAGLSPTRHHEQIVAKIALHASKDKLREMNVEKSRWEGNYLRPNSKRFQTIITGSDMHDINCDPFYYRLFIDTIKRVQPEKIILNGDVFDFPEFSKYTNDPRDYKIIDRIQWVHLFLGDIRAAAPDAEIKLSEGNHEHRVFRHLAEAAPSIVSILSDLHGFTIAKLLGLDKFEVNLYAKADLTAFNSNDINKELKKNYIIENKQIIFHHFPEGKSFGMPGVHGHHHKFLMWNEYSPMFGSYSWIQSGCGHKRYASYTEGAKWQTGFVICHLDTQEARTQFEIIDTSALHCMVGGKFYERTEEEAIYFA